MTTNMILNKKNRIVEVGPSWDRFARENGAPDIVFDSIAGSLIWDHIMGDETKEFFSKLFFACREWHQLLAFEYRCDSPRLERLLRQTIKPCSNDGLLIENQLLSERSIARGPNIIRFRAKTQSSRCSRCCSIRAGDSYVDPFVLEEDILDIGDYGICPVCQCDPEDMKLIAQQF